MKGDGDEALDVPPQPLFPLERPVRESGQLPPERAEPAVFEEEDGLLETAAIAPRTPVESEGRGRIQAAPAEMAFPRPLEETAAARAVRGPAGDDFVQAVPADDPLPRPFEKLSAGPAERGEDNDFRQADKAGEPGWGAGFQVVSDSAFSWHSIHKGVQGRAFSRLRLISFWQV